MSNINYYTTGLTAHGHKSFLCDNVKDIKDVYYLKGKLDFTSLINSLVILWDKEEYELEYIHNPFRNGFLEAVINKTLSKAVIIKAAPHIEYNFEDIENMQTYDFNVALDTKSYFRNREKINDLISKSNDYNEKAYAYFAKALRVHDEWEKVYIDNMDFNKADTLAKDLITKLIGNNEKEKKAMLKDRFLGAATPDGARDFITDLTREVDKRYFIKGRPGSGKSTILRKIVAKAVENGLDTEIYHCGFDYNSLDMVILRELNTCIFDSTAPHEHFPDRESDVIVDVYKEAINENTDENYADILDDIKKRYKNNINQAINELKVMEETNNKIIAYYNSVTDFATLNDLSLCFLKELSK